MHKIQGAGSARPQMRLCFHRWIAPLGHRHIINGPAQMICLGLRMALPRGRGDRAPPRTPPSALCQGFPREAIQAWIADPSEGRALHARNIRIATYRDISPFGHQLLAKSSVIMLCPGLRPALPRGRGDRAPPRTPTSALCQGFPRKAILPWVAHPSEGRAPHARK